MDRGEHATIDSDTRHCYGENGCEEKQIPPVSSDNSYRMKIDLEFHDWQDPTDVQILSTERRLYWGFVVFKYIAYQYGPHSISLIDSIDLRLCSTLVHLAEPQVSRKIFYRRSISSNLVGVND